MYAFAYERPERLEDVVALLAGDPDARILAGGQTLLPMLKHRLAMPSTLVDLRAVRGLRGIDVREEAAVIGAMTEHAAVAASPDVRRAIPALARLAAGIGDPVVRNMGTIGGSIANNDPAADYPAAVLGCGARIHTDRRTIEADAFFSEMYETALEPDEVITRIEFPIPRAAGYAKIPHPASGYVLTGAFVARTAEGFRVAINGAGPCVFRHAESEAALSQAPSHSALSRIALSAEDLLADLHASAEYRAHLAGVALRNATLQALEDER